MPVAAATSSTLTGVSAARRTASTADRRSAWRVREGGSTDCIVIIIITPSNFAPPPRDTAVDLSRLLPDVDLSDLTARLRTVVDPEIGVNVVDLGLVYESDLQAGVAHVLMATTTPACPIGSFLEDQVRWALLDAPGVVDVEVEIAHEPAWSPARMTPDARRALGLPA